MERTEIITAELLKSCEVEFFSQLERDRYYSLISQTNYCPKGDDYSSTIVFQMSSEYLYQFEVDKFMGWFGSYVVENHTAKDYYVIPEDRR